MLGTCINAKDSSVVKIENTKLLKSVADAVGGRFVEVESVDDCYQLLASAPGVSTRPQLSKISFEITPELVIPCVHFASVMKATAPTLGKQVAGERNTVKRDTTYRNPEDLDEIVDGDYKVRGYRYGDQFIPMTADDEAMFKVEGPAVLKVIGTIPLNSIPRHHLLEGTIILQGSPDIASAQFAVMALRRAMASLEYAILVRCVKRENADPFLGVLLPNNTTCESVDIKKHGTPTLTCTNTSSSTAEPADHLLILHRLPTAEDIRDYAFPSLIQFAEVNEGDGAKDASLKRKASAMSSFVDAMTIDPPSDKFIKPINPYLRDIYTEIQKVLVSGSVSSTRPSNSTPRNSLFYELQQNAIPMTEQLYNLFPLERVDKSRRKKKKEYWSELDIKVTPGLL